MSFKSMAEVIAACKPQIKVHEFDIPGFGTFYHKDLVGTRRDIYMQWQAVRITESHNRKDIVPDMKGGRALLLASALCDEEGNFLSNDPIKDAALIQTEFPANHLYDITDEIGLVNGLTAESETDAEKNSSTTGTPDSGSSCQADGAAQSES